jgi:hypothetical protein
MKNMDGLPGVSGKLAALVFLISHLFELGLELFKRPNA